MYRFAISALIGVLVVVGLIAWAPGHSEAQIEPTVAIVTPSPVPTCEADWRNADIRPAYGAVVNPVTPIPDTPPAHPDERELYVVEIMIPPGGCSPSVAPGNQRNGAIVLIVQQGKVSYVWEPYDWSSNPAATPPPGPPVVQRGDLAFAEDDTPTPVPEGTPQILYAGDWITQNQRVVISMTNIGGETAIILKGAFVEPPPGGGCHGDCKGG